MFCASIFTTAHAQVREASTVTLEDLLPGHRSEVVNYNDLPQFISLNPKVSADIEKMRSDAEATGRESIICYPQDADGVHFDTSSSKNGSAYEVENCGSERGPSSIKPEDYWRPTNNAYPFNIISMHPHPQVAPGIPSSTDVANVFVGNTPIGIVVGNKGSISAQNNGYLDTLIFLTAQSIKIRDNIFESKFDAEAMKIIASPTLGGDNFKQAVGWEDHGYRFTVAAMRAKSIAYFYDAAVNIAFNYDDPSKQALFHQRYGYAIALGLYCQQMQFACYVRRSPTGNFERLSPATVAGEAVKDFGQPRSDLAYLQFRKYIAQPSQKMIAVPATNVDGTEKALEDYKARLERTEAANSPEVAEVESYIEARRQPAYKFIKSLQIGELRSVCDHLCLLADLADLGSRRFADPNADFDEFSYTTSAIQVVFPKDGKMTAAIMPATQSSYLYNSFGMLTHDIQHGMDLVNPSVATESFEINIQYKDSYSCVRQTWNIPVLDYNTWVGIIRNFSSPYDPRSHYNISRDDHIGVIYGAGADIFMQPQNQFASVRCYLPSGKQFGTAESAVVDGRWFIISPNHESVLPKPKPRDTSPAWEQPDKQSSTLPLKDDLRPAFSPEDMTLATAGIAIEAPDLNYCGSQNQETANLYNQCEMAKMNPHSIYLMNAPSRAQ